MAYTEFYCQTTASNLNAGSTTADAATYTSAAGDSDGTSVFTPNDGSTPANSVNVGDWASVYVTVGATTAVFVGRVTAVGAGVNGTITCSTTAKSGTFPTASAGAHTITCKVGGAWQGPSGTTNFPFNFITSAQTDSAGDYPRVNFKGGTTYSITAAVTHSLAGPTVFQGYTTTAGDGGRATIDGGTSGVSYVLLTLSGANNILRDLVLQNNGASSTATGVVITGDVCLLERITVNSVRGFGVDSQVNGIVTFLECEAYACNQSNTSSTGAFTTSNSNQRATYVRCISHDNSGSNNVGYLSSGSSTYIGCVADSNGKQGFSFTGGSTSTRMEGCVIYGNGSDGISFSGNTSLHVLDNCMFANNGGYGVNNSGASTLARLVNCAFFSNTSGQTNGTVDASGSITCTSAPMADPANGNFAANTNEVQGTGRGSYIQNSGSYTKTTVGYPDVGIQHQDVAKGPPFLMLVGGLMVGA